MFPILGECPLPVTNFEFSSSYDIKKKEFDTNLGNVYKQVYDFLNLDDDIRGKHNTQNDNLYTLLTLMDSVKFPKHTDGGSSKKTKYKTKKRGGRLHMKTHRRK